MNVNVMTAQQATLDLSIIMDSLVDNDFVDSTDAHADSQTVEYSKVYRDGSEVVFGLDFNDYSVTKDLYNSKGVRQNDASFNRSVKHTRDIELIVNSIA